MLSGTISFGRNGAIIASFNVNIPQTTLEKTTGLGGITPAITSGTGMLFDMQVEALMPVNMRPMLFPLDVVFINNSGVVTEVRRNVSVTDVQIESLAPCRFFLEVNAGDAVQVNAADIVSITGYAPPALVPDIMSTIMPSMISMMMLMMFMKMMTGMMKNMSDDDDRPSMVRKYRTSEYNTPQS